MRFSSHFIFHFWMCTNTFGSLPNSGLSSLLNCLIRLKQWRSAESFMWMLRAHFIVREKFQATPHVSAHLCVCIVENINAQQDCIWSRQINWSYRCLMRTVAVHLPLTLSCFNLLNTHKSKEKKTSWKKMRPRKLIIISIERYTSVVMTTHNN